MKRYALGEAPVCTGRESRSSHMDSYWRLMKYDANPQAIDTKNDLTALVFNCPSITNGKQYIHQIIILEKNRKDRLKSEGFCIASNTIPTDAEIRELIAPKRFHQNTTPID